VVNSVAALVRGIAQLVSGLTHVLLHLAGVLLDVAGDLLALVASHVAGHFLDRALDFTLGTLFTVLVHDVTLLWNLRCVRKILSCWCGFVAGTLRQVSGAPGSPDRSSFDTP